MKFGVAFVVVYAFIFFIGIPCLVFQPWQHDTYVVDKSWGDGAWVEKSYIQERGGECGHYYKSDLMRVYAAFTIHDIFGGTPEYFATLTEAKNYVEKYCTPNLTLPDDHNS